MEQRVGLLARTWWAVSGSSRAGIIFIAIYYSFVLAMHISIVFM
jgi:hypothetical protein